VKKAAPSEKQFRKDQSKVNPAAGQINIQYYTDPLCCWSWAFEQQWRKLLNDFGDKIRYEYVLCGMIPNWETYNDPLNAVSRPLQMGPVWMHASQTTGVPMDYSIWHRDPPSSSYPACIAVKCARLQSLQAEDLYLQAVRKALMERGENIARPEILLSVAESVENNSPEYFDLELFKRHWKEGKGKEEFRADIQKMRYHNIGRYPSLTFTNASEKGIIIVGYRPYEALRTAFEHIASL
jgi:putative protein-disulfide isomerase